jgi:hypothetical protein
MLDARKAVVGLTAVGQGLVAAGSDLTDPWPLGHLFRAVAEDARAALVTGNVTMSAASCAQPPYWKGPRPGPGASLRRGNCVWASGRGMRGRATPRSARKPIIPDYSYRPFFTTP